MRRLLFQKTFGIQTYYDKSTVDYSTLLYSILFQNTLGNNNNPSDLDQGQHTIIPDFQFTNHNERTVFTTISIQKQSTLADTLQYLKRTDQLFLICSKRREKKKLIEGGNESKVF